jgi:hypothetical protein
VKKKLFFLCLVFVLVFLITLSSFNVIKVYSISQDTPVGGVLSGDTVWTLADSPYVLRQDVQVPNGVTLTIEPGVVIESGKNSLQVWGTLKAIGTNTQKIRFYGTYIVPGPIYDNDKSKPSLIDVEFSEIDGGSIYPPVLHTTASSLILRDSLIKNTESCIFIWYPTSDCYIERNVFINSHRISVGTDGKKVFIRNNVFLSPNISRGYPDPGVSDSLHIPYAVENWADYGYKGSLDTTSTIVQYNSFLDTNGIAVGLSPNYVVAAILADHNYWGTTDVSKIESMIFDKNDNYAACASYITYTPILDRPDQNTPNVVVTLTASASPGGSISPAGTVTVNLGDSKTFTIIPNNGYHIKDVKVDGKSVGAVSTYTFNNITSDHTIEATFEPTTFTIAASTGSGGSISLSGTIIVNYGDSKTFTITPDKGYKISDVKVDGKSVGAVSTYTFTNVINNHTIEVVFEKNQIVIVLQIGKTSFTVNGVPSTLDSPPIIRNGRTLLPIRAVVESLGGTVGWEPSLKVVSITLGAHNLSLQIGSYKATVDGKVVQIDPDNPKVVPEIINGRTMLPLRFVTENLGCDVKWDGGTKTITITYQQ